MPKLNHSDLAYRDSLKRDKKFEKIKIKKINEKQRSKNDFLRQCLRDYAQKKALSAASYGDNKRLQDLIEAYPAINLTKVLNEACFYNQYSTAVMLVTTYKVDVNVVDDSNLINPAPIFSAISSGNPKIVELLLKNGLKINNKINFAGGTETALAYCFKGMGFDGRLEKEYIPILRLLLQYGASPDEKVYFNCLRPMSFAEVIEKKAFFDLKDELRDLLKSKEDVSVDELTKLMHQHSLQPKKEEALLFAFEKMKINEYSEPCSDDNDDILPNVASSSSSHKMPF